VRGNRELLSQVLTNLSTTRSSTEPAEESAASDTPTIDVSVALDANGRVE